MRKPRRLDDAFRFPGFRPEATVRGIFGDPKARILRLRRRGKKRPAGRVDGGIGPSTTARPVECATSPVSVGYYVDEKGLEPAGVWYGPGAAEFGLSGIVQAEHLSRLCEGVDPHNPEKNLVRNAKTERRAHGTDLCFSAPKSVSIAWALASPELREAIEAKMHRAVRDALDYIQDQCGFAPVGAQGQRTEKIPLMFALFEHSSSRAGDAQLHIHAVCPNVTMHPAPPGSKARTTAIDPTGFYHHMMAGGAVMRASLAEGLRELGFEIERDKSCFRIKGISLELCERTSQRRAEILEALFERCKTLGRLGGLSEEEILKST